VLTFGRTLVVCEERQSLSNQGRPKSNLLLQPPASRSHIQSTGNYHPHSGSLRIFLEHTVTSNSHDRDGLGLEA
jgi:hypothetical protein